MKGLMMELTQSQRATILAKIDETVGEKYYDPAFNQGAWAAMVSKHRSAILDATTAKSFENAVSLMLAELSPKGLGLLSERTPINPRNAINASFSVHQVDDGLRWVFQDVLPHGVAEKAGIRTGDILLSAAGKNMEPTSETAAEPPFEMAHAIPVTIRRGVNELTCSLQNR